MTGQAGSVLGGRYRLREPVGRGGMGAVWRASDIVLDREVAIKILALPPQQSPKGSARFLREARILGRLSHPRLGGVHDYGEEDGLAYTVMEFLTGETVAHRLVRAGRIPPAEAAEIAAQVAEGLHAAHEAGVIHRDVKPANIILTGQGVKLVDFGIALGADDDPLTATGTLIGSATYLAPERGTGGHTTPACDLYSLGVVLYEMLAGRPPFTAADPVELVSAHSTAAVPPLPAGVPAGLAEWCMRAMAKDPAARPAAALDFAVALRGSTSRGRHAAVTATTATAAAPPVPQPAAAPGDTWRTAMDGRIAESGAPTATLPVAQTETWQPPRRTRRLWLAAAAGLVIVVAAGAVAAVTAAKTPSRSTAPPATRHRSHSSSAPAHSGAAAPAATWVISAGADPSNPPPPALLAPAGTTVRLAETLHNGEQQPIEDATLALAAPPGWTATPQAPASTGVISPGGAATVTWAVSVPAAAHPGQFKLVATARCAAPCATDPVTGSAVVPFASFSQTFDNVGIAAQAGSAAANFDGIGQSFSEEALAAAGYLPGAQVTHDGISFAWPNVPPGAPDNVAAQGQTFLLAATGAHLAFLGAADFGSSGGDGTIYYQDGTQQSFHLVLDDWWTTGPKAGQDEVAVTVPQFNGPAGQPPPSGPPVAVYFAAIPLQPGKTVEAVTLPAGAGPADGVPSLHLFAVAVG